jgi:acetoacetyl-CoA synthetase
VASYDDAGKRQVDEVGELVLTEPMPSIPVSFRAEPGSSRCARFQDFPGVERHGDWIKVTSRGSCVVYGRSDSTLKTCAC